jgi:hypothetical protein
MRFVVNLTSPNVTESLKHGNFRGEPRWERQATEALLELGHPVHTISNGTWSPSNTKPHNLHYCISNELAKEAVCLAHDFQPDSVPPIFKSSIFNMFSTHYFRDIPEKVTNYKNIYKQNLVFTQGYLNSQNEKDIIKAVGKEYVEYLGCPSANKVHYQDNFNKPNLVWLSRGVHLHAFPGKENPELIQFIDWVKERLEKDSNLKFFIITGLSQRDMDWQKWNCTVEERVWQSTVIQRLNSVKSQVVIPVNLDWCEVLDIMADTKLSISIAPDRWGGPPVEAGMFGIPYVAPQDHSLYKHMGAGLLEASHLTDRIKLYTQLMDNHEMYRSHGDLYREFIKNNHTYESFQKQLLSILKKRGIE